MKEKEINLSSETENPSSQDSTQSVTEKTQAENQTLTTEESDISIACKNEKTAREYIETVLRNEEVKAERLQRKREQNKRIGGTLQYIVTLCAFIAALVSMFFLGLIGQSVRCIGEVRNVDAEYFTMFTSKSIGDYLVVLSEVQIAEMLTANGVFATEEMVKAYATMSITETIVAIAMVVGVVGFFILSVFDFIRNVKDGFKCNRMLGALGTVVVYVCGAIILKSMEYGEISIAFKERGRVVSTFSLTLGFNTPTIIGIVVAILLMASSFVCKAVSEVLTEEKRERKGIILDNSVVIAPVAERVLTAIVAVFTVIAILLAGTSAVKSTSKGISAVYYKNEVTGNYETKNYNEEMGTTLTIASLLKQYANEEKELNYKISVCDSKLKENSTNLIEIEIEKDGYRTALVENQQLMKNALNFGLTTIYVNIALIVFSGVFLCFILNKKRNNTDLTILVAAVQTFGALVGLILMIFINVSFARLQVYLVNVAPYFHFVLVIASLIGTFFIRKFNRINKQN